MKRPRQPWKLDYRTSKRPWRPSPLRQRASKSQPDGLRETFISLLRESDGEVLHELLKTLSRDKSLYARRLVECLVEQPELRD